MTEQRKETVYEFSTQEERDRFLAENFPDREVDTTRPGFFHVDERRKLGVFENTVTLYEPIQDQPRYKMIQHKRYGWLEAPDRTWFEWRGRMVYLIDNGHRARGDGTLYWSAPHGTAWRASNVTDFVEQEPEKPKRRRAAPAGGRKNAKAKAAVKATGTTRSKRRGAK